MKTQKSASAPEASTPVDTSALRTRPSARLLVIDPSDCVLLFRFAHSQGPLAGQTFWATPGGGVECDEILEDAARRELQEETGLVVDHPGPVIHRRQAVFQMPDGEYVVSDERFFLIRIGETQVTNTHWTELEREVIAEHRWWSLGALRATTDQVWPEGLPDLLASLGVRSSSDHAAETL